MLKKKIRSYSRKNASAFCIRVSALERTMYLLQRRLEQGDAIMSLLADTKGKLEEALLSKHRDAIFALKSNRQRRVKPLLFFHPLEEAWSIAIILCY